MFENQNPRKRQTGADYYIHPRWTDEQVKTFRRRVREQNICVRFGFQDIQHYKDWIKHRRKTKPLVNRGLFNGVTVKLACPPPKTNNAVLKRGRYF